MRSFLPVAVTLIALASAVPVAAADVTRIELHQREEVVLKHERFVGNLRAQAKRAGIIVRVPQLYVYFTDRSPAWHLHGYRRGFERELGLTYRHGRRERSMAAIDRLLERTVTPEGEAFTIDTLAEADVYLLLYRASDCDDCLKIESALDGWLDESPDLSAVWFDVWVDRLRLD